MCVFFCELKKRNINFAILVLSSRDFLKFRAISRKFKISRQINKVLVAELVFALLPIPNVLRIIYLLVSIIRLFKSITIKKSSSRRAICVHLMQNRNSTHTRNKPTKCRYNIITTRILGRAFYSLLLAVCSVWYTM